MHCTSNIVNVCIKCWLVCMLKLIVSPSEWNMLMQPDDDSQFE